MQQKLCQKCGCKMNKWGKDRNGKQRWRCQKCGKSKVITKSKITENNHLKKYKQFLQGKQSLSECAQSYNLSKSGLAKQFVPFRQLTFTHEQADMSKAPRCKRNVK